MKKSLHSLKSMKHHMNEWLLIFAYIKAIMNIEVVFNTSILGN